MIFLKRKNKSIDFINRQISNFLKAEKRFIPFYIKSSNDFDVVDFIGKLINSFSVTENAKGDRPLLKLQQTQNIAWLFFSNNSKKIAELQNYKNDFLFINWQNPDLIRYKDFLQMTRDNKKSIILIIDESHKLLTEEVFRQLFIPANPKIIIKISPEPFETKKDKRIFKKSISSGNVGCYFTCQ